MATSESKLRDELVQFKIENVEGLQRSLEGKSGEFGSSGELCKVTVKEVPRMAKRLQSIMSSSDIRPSEKRGIQEKFYKECLLLSELEHPNVIEFIGVHFSRVDRSDVSMILEPMHSDLETYLNPDERPNVPLSIKLSILFDVSAGLLCLHTQLDQPLLHCNLTAQNILLSKDLRAKISSFGVSKLLKFSHPNEIATYIQQPDTVAHLPPELLCDNPQYDTHLDVFLFGQLALHIANQQFPDVNDDVMDTELNLAFHFKELLKRKRWIDMLPLNHCLRGVILKCLQDQPTQRLTTYQLYCTVKDLSLKNPKSLQDVIMAWGDKTEVFHAYGYNTVYSDPDTQFVYYIIGFVYIAKWRV